MGQALFIYDEQSKHLIEPVRSNKYGVAVTAIDSETFLARPDEHLATVSHLVISGGMGLVRSLVEFAYTRGAEGAPCTLGFLPLSSQNALRRSYQLSNSLDDNIEIALRNDAKPVCLVLCNDKIVQFKAVIGRIPLLEAWHVGHSVPVILKNMRLGLKQFTRLALDKLVVETEKGQKISSVASGILVTSQNGSGRSSKDLLAPVSMRSNKVSMIILSPYSVIEYLLFLVSLLFNTGQQSDLPHGVSNVQSSQITLDLIGREGVTPRVRIDDLESASFPLSFKVVKDALNINAPEKFWEVNPVVSSDKEVIRTNNLPDEKEMVKYLGHSIPLFSVASEDHFKDLFLQLRGDAKTNSMYIVLMLLSTLLASFGLLADSPAVVIGAMLIAPLMSPIIASSMGLLRGDGKLIRQSLEKIGYGLGLAIVASCLLTVILPQIDLSDEIKARIHPNLVDLGIAVISGIAAAYTKSNKELLNSLAGVAIAVALVPPLATAGIGLGRGELYVFEGALLLFATNLFGIIVASTLTFHFLGYSNTVKSKKSLLVIVMTMLALSYPLYRSYADSLQRYRLTQELLREEITINQKPVLIESAEIGYQNNIRVIDITVVVKKVLTDLELQVLKKRIDKRFTTEHQIRVSQKYIL